MTNITTFLFILQIVTNISIYVGSMVKWLENCAYDQHDLGSKPTCAILLCSWERHFMVLLLDWWSCQAVPN